MTSFKNIAVVLNYNDLENTLNFVQEIQNYRSVDKIVIVDNCSNDDSFERLCDTDFNGKVDLIRTKKNEGYGVGNNYGIKYAEKKYNPKYIIVSNPDIEVSEGTIKRIINFLEDNPIVSASTGLVYTPEIKIAKNFAWKQPTYWDALLESSFLFKILLERVFNYSNRYPISSISRPTMKVDVLSGCFFIVRAQSIKEVGYFSDKTFLYNEENILFGKLNAADYQQYVLTNEVIIHRQGSTISKNVNKWKMKSGWLIKGGEVYITDHLKVNNFMRCFFVRGSNILKYERYASLLLKNKIVSILNHIKAETNE